MSSIRARSKAICYTFLSTPIDHFTLSATVLFPDMGSCFCRPITEVTENPTVVMYTDVGYCVQTGHSSTDFITICRYGLAYVEDGNFFVEGTLGSRFCCANAGSSSKLFDIKQVEVVQGSFTISRRDQYGRYGYGEEHHMNPGLRIVLKNDKKILMTMPAAENFCARLCQLCNLPTTNYGRLPLQNMLQPGLGTLMPNVPNMWGAPGLGTLAPNGPNMQGAPGLGTLAPVGSNMWGTPGMVTLAPVGIVTRAPEYIVPTAWGAPGSGTPTGALGTFTLAPAAGGPGSGTPAPVNTGSDSSTALTSWSSSEPLLI